MKEDLRVAFFLIFLNLASVMYSTVFFSIYYYIISYHIISYHIILYYIISYYIILYYIIYIIIDITLYVCSNILPCHPPQGSPTQSLKILASSLVIYGPGSQPGPWWATGTTLQVVAEIRIWLDPIYKKNIVIIHIRIYIYIIVGWINIPDQVMGCSPGCSRVSLCYPRLWALCGDDPATFGAHPDAIHPGRNAVPLRRPAKCREPLAAAWIPRWRQHVG